MHLASLEQQCELMRYMNSLNEWLGHDVEDRQAELRGVSHCIDQLLRADNLVSCRVIPWVSSAEASIIESTLV
jgi:adenylylsulfate kinase-like enzyme